MGQTSVEPRAGFFFLHFFFERARQSRARLPLSLTPVRLWPRKGSVLAITIIGLGLWFLVAESARMASSGSRSGCCWLELRLDL